MDAIERRRIGQIASVTGIVCNLLLFLLKIIVGTTASSLSVIADAFNNLSDSFSSLVSLVTVRISGKPADHHHPYGHGRIEYIASFMVALLIFLVGVNLFRSSIERLISPSPLSVSSLGIVLLLASILVKFSLFLYFRHTGKTAELPVLLLSSMDALFDCLMTLITIAALVLSPYVSFNLDVWAAFALSFLILFTSIRQIRNAVSPLLGNNPSDTLAHSLESIATKHSEVLNVHDILLHDYGYHLLIGSMHIELPESMSFHDAHSIADSIEKEANQVLNIQLVVHADPVSTDDPQRQDMLRMTEEITASYESGISIHDFQLDSSGDSLRLSFDLQIPFQTSPEIEHDLQFRIRNTLLQHFPGIEILIHVDHV